MPPAQRIDLIRVVGQDAARPKMVNCEIECLLRERDAASPMVLKLFFRHRVRVEENRIEKLKPPDGAHQYWQPSGGFNLSTRWMEIDENLSKSACRACLGELANSTLKVNYLILLEGNSYFTSRKTRSKTVKRPLAPVLSVEERLAISQSASS